MHVTFVCPALIEQKSPDALVIAEQDVVPLLSALH